MTNGTKSSTAFLFLFFTLFEIRLHIYEKKYIDIMIFFIFSRVDSCSCQFAVFTQLIIFASCFLQAYSIKEEKNRCMCGMFVCIRCGTRANSSFLYSFLLSRRARHMCRIKIDITERHNMIVRINLIFCCM